MWPAGEKGPEQGLEKQAGDYPPEAIGEIKHFTLHQWKAKGTEYANIVCGCNQGGSWDGSDTPTNTNNLLDGGLDVGGDREGMMKIFNSGE